MWSFSSAGRASDVEADLVAIDPASMDGDMERGARAALLAFIRACPPQAGCITRARVTGVGVSLSVDRIKFGSYAL